MVSRQEVLKAACETDGVAFGAAEVAERIDLGPARTREKLQAIAEDGTLHRKRIGATDVFWFNGH